MSSVHDLQAQLCDLLGINWQDATVTGFTLRVRAGSVPTITLRREIFNPGQIRPEALVCRFTLEPVPEAAPTPEPEALDLDTLCEAAMQRVRAGIEADAAHHLAAMSVCFQAARRGVRDRHDNLIAAHRRCNRQSRPVLGLDLAEVSAAARKIGAALARCPISIMPLPVRHA
ncbi:MAG TPA: hypothetical protein VEA40_00450 [Ramlibacter sp.]|nr:hypothetical protein [Ramlibacter sp.]